MTIEILTKFRKICKEDVDIDKQVSKEKEEMFDSIKREQEYYGEMYKPKETLLSFLFGKKCPACGTKLEKIEVSNIRIIYVCEYCKYRYAERKRVIHGGD